MDDSLSFNVAQLLRDPVGTSRHVDVSAELGHLAPELSGLSDEGEVSTAQISGPVRMMHINDGVLVQGKLNVRTTLACARCLEPVAVEFQFDLEEVYKPTVDLASGKVIIPEEEDRALWIDDHHILDLTEVLRQDVLIAQPLHVVCREECRGLCPTCGRNLNEGACGCPPEADPRWSALADLLKTE